MKNLIKIVVLLFIGTTSYSQQNLDIQIQSPQYTNSGQSTIALANCGNIDLGSSISTSINFGINLSKPVGLSVGLSDLYVYTQRFPSDYRNTRMWQQIQESLWNHPSSTTDTYSTTASFTLNASEFNISGGTIFVVFKSNGGTEYQTVCSFTISKAQAPSFSLNPTNTSFPCGDLSPRTFTITPSNVPSGATVTYQWNYSGWTPVGSTSNPKTLQPFSGTTLPSTVSVTPFVNGVAYPNITCLISRATFISAATVTGTTNICSGTATYAISGVLAGQTVSWSLSNASGATLSSQSGTQTNVTFNSNGAQTLTATITNACGQTVTKPFVINTGTATFTSAATISGSNLICPRGNNVYTISGVATGNTVTWSSSNTAFATVNSPTQSQVTLHGVANGLVTLTATLTNACGQTATIPFTITVGSPLLPASGLDSKPIWIRTGYINTNFTFAPITGVTSYYWTIVKNAQSFACAANFTETNFNDNGLLTLTTSTPTATLKIGTCASDYLVTCSIANQCGSTVVYQRFLTVGPSGSSPCNINQTVALKTAIINPIKDGTLILKKLNTPIAIDDEFVVSNILPGDVPCEGPYPAPTLRTIKNNNNLTEIKIYDMIGNQVYYNEYIDNGDTHEIKGLFLKQGSYIIHVTSAKETSKQIIIVE